MRNLKTNNFPTVTIVKKTTEVEAQHDLAPITKTNIPAYPTVWKKAFTMGQNVRFTRTPEVEIVRRRVESDPEFAQKLHEFAEAEQLRREIAAQKRTQMSEPVQVNQGKTHYEAVTVDKAANEVNIIRSNVNMVDADKLHQKGHFNDEIFTDKPIEIDILSSQTTVKSNFISDFAFFECGPFEIDNDVEDHSDRAVFAQALTPTPTQQTAIIVDRDHIVAQSRPEKSITDLYRVLECRFSHANQSLATKSDDNHVAAASIETAPESDAQKALRPRVNITKDNAIQFADVEKVQKENNLAETGKQTHVNIIRDQQIITESVDIKPVQTVVETAVEFVAPAQKNLDNSNLEITKLTTQNIEIADDSQWVEPALPSKVELSSKVEVTMPAPPIRAPFRSLNPAFIKSPTGANYGAYEFPSIDLLQEAVYKDGAIISQESLERSAGLLESVLEDFGVKGEIIHVRPGPVVTMYEFEPAAGVKSSRVIGLSDDIARSMSAISTRVAVIPGRNVIGIELPNAVSETVYLRELIQSTAFDESNFKLALALGKSIGGEPVVAELAKMPHLLVAGTTGSGKSVAINTMILSLLYRMTPEQCRLIMVDPKMLELSIYDGIPHLLTPVVTDPKKAVTALKWAVREMEDRYRKMAKLGVRNIDGFNARVATAAEKDEVILCTVQSGFDKETGEMLYHEEAMDLTQLPYIVIVVDEMADLMMVAGKEIEGAIQRLAQMARAAGIHLIMATQRPSVDVITGTIKANFPTRISFQVTSKIDSRTILGEQGAETLLGHGDMLHMVGGGRIVRVHGPFVSDEEVEKIVAHLKTQGTPDYLATVTDSDEDDDTLDDADSIADIVAAGSGSEDGEELYLQAVKVVMRDKKCSTSYIQRRLSIGYNKAASLVERMEQEGIVGSANHVGKREILLNGRNV